VSAYQLLVCDHKIPQVGTAFGSKYLHFAGDDTAAILDSVVARWIGEHAGIRLTLSRDARNYGRYLEVLHGWAAALGLTTEQVELVIFTDGLPEGSPWRPDEDE
jgi:thermostable 8-oxoguanine DNA glycosylase